MKNKAIWAILLILVAGVSVSNLMKNEGKSDIRIGVITPLTGGVSYWGESSLTGIKLAQIDLKKKGIEVDVIVEDGQLDPKTALSAAQKLVNVDSVSAMYSEFNPAAIAVSSFLKDKNIIQIYDATPTSPLALSQNFYKTYLDYEVSCGQVADILKDRGHRKVGVLKMNLEHGELCLKGIRKTFGDKVMVESYDPGQTDFRTSLLKLDKQEIDVVFHASFQPETLASLRNMRTLGMRQTFVGLSETITPDIVPEYKDMLEDAITFGLPKVSRDLIQRMKVEVEDARIIDENAAGLAYVHITQLAGALSVCGTDTKCSRQKLNESAADPRIGFQGFRDRVAGFDTLIEEWKGGKATSI